jgi:hypothetical protein
MGRGSDTAVRDAEANGNARASMEYTEMEIKCIVAGLGHPAEKDALWFNPSYRGAIEHLMELGLVVTGGRPNAQGQALKIPLSLTRFGVTEARRLKASGT